MKLIKSKSVDLILCDLPYGTTNCKWDIIIDFNKLWEQYERIIKDHGAIILFGSEPFSSHLRLSNLKLYKYDLYWKKEKPTNFFQLKKRFGKNTENILVFYKKQPKYHPQMQKSKFDRPIVTSTNKKHKSIVAGRSDLIITPYKDTGLRYPTDILEFNREKLGSTQHPTQKPIELLEYLIKSFTNEQDLVLDNTMGSGSTGVACINLDRQFIGIEKLKKHFKIAEKRISEAINKKTKG